MLKRYVVCVGLDDRFQFPKKNIENQGWEVITARSIQEAKLLIQGQLNCFIGILFTTKGNIPQVDEVKDLLLSRKPMEWIAVLQKECIDSISNCRFIHTYFYDYHTYPIDQSRLLVTLGRAYGKVLLKRRLVKDSDSKGQHNMIGQSPAMIELYKKMNTMSGVKPPVLIRGESGSGKELVAQAIHQHSSHKHNPFIAVNCGSLPSHIIQSELFGYEKGAFTGADKTKIGRIEAAAGGTIFLDEIGDMKLDLQVNLLRFLQEKTIMRVGSNENISIETRVIAATHIDLEQAVSKGTFRKDLYYRLNVLSLTVPPLRERYRDIQLLAQYFFDKFAQKKNFQAKGFSQQALEIMSTYSWPGNVRELINRVQRAILLSKNNLITATDLGLNEQSIANKTMSLDTARLKAEEELIRRTLMVNSKNVSKTARDLGVSRVTLYRVIKRCNISI